MTEEELDAIDQLMRNRDHWLLHSEDFSRLNTLALMDKVPGLVAEVRHLLLRNEDLRAAIGALGQRLHDIAGHVGSFQFCAQDPCPETWKRYQGKCDKHHWNEVGYALTSQAETSGPIKRCSFCGDYERKREA